MSRAEFRYMIESVVGGAVHNLRSEMVVAQAALKEEIQTEITHCLCLETTKKIEALQNKFGAEIVELCLETTRKTEALNEEIRTGLEAAVQITQSLCSETTRKIEAHSA